MPNDVHKLLAAERQRADALEAENAWLKEARQPANVALRKAFGLRKVEAAIVAILAQGGVFSAARIVELCLGENATIKCVYVYMSHIRDKIEPYKINTLWLDGYSIEGDSLAAIRAIIDGGKA